VILAPAIAAISAVTDWVVGADAPALMATAIRLSLSEKAAPFEVVLRTQPSGYWIENPEPEYVSQTTLSGMSPAAATVPEGSGLDEGVVPPLGEPLDPHAAAIPIATSAVIQRSRDSLDMNINRTLPSQPESTLNGA
jgi:hypothetical protein